MVSNKKNEFVCYRYGQSSHSTAHCSLDSTQCHKCGKLGHIKRMCQLKKALRMSILQIPEIAGLHKQRVRIPEV